MGRSENIVFKLETSDLSQEALIRKLCPGFPIMIDGDNVKVSYTLQMKYFGEVVNKLEYIERLLDSPTVRLTKATMTSLNTARCLIKDIVLKLDRIAG